MMRVFTIVRKFGILDCVRGIDFLLGQEFAELPPAAVRADHPDDRDVVDEFAQIPRDIGRAAGIKALAGHFDHRHGRLRRNPADFAPDELVQHQIADDEDAFCCWLRRGFLLSVAHSCASVCKEIGNAASLRG